MTLKFNPFTNRLDITETGGGGGGDVTGPGSSTDNAVVRWSGTTGTLVQNSVVTISDTGDIVANSIDLTVPVDAVDGGTGISSFSVGDILYADSTTTLAKLSVGSDSDVLTLSGGLPTWAAAAGGGVTSVSGTANRISSTGGATPVIDIAATYVGQTSITTLGTVTTGTWNGTTIAVANGGTGQTTLTNHGVLVGAAASAITQLAAGSAGQVLQSGGASADPAYSTATYPATATGTGTILRADGTNWVASTATYPNTATTGDLLYGSASNVYSNLALSTFPGAPVANDGTTVVWGDPLKYVYFVDDFITGTNNTSLSVLGWLRISVSGGSYNLTALTSSAHPGIISGQMGTGAGGGGGVYLSNVIILGGGTITLNFIVNVPVLSDATDSFIIRFGFGDRGNSINAPNNGCYFEYTHSVNSGAWQILTASGGSRTTNNTSSTVDTNWHRFTIVINSGATSIAYYIDGSEVTNSPITTNISTANATAPFMLITRTAGSTNDRFVHLDLFSICQVLTTSR